MDTTRTSVRIRVTPIVASSSDMRWHQLFNRVFRLTANPTTLLHGVSALAHDYPMSCLSGQVEPCRVTGVAQTLLHAMFYPKVNKPDKGKVVRSTEQRRQIMVPQRRNGSGVQTQRRALTASYTL